MAEQKKSIEISYKANISDLKKKLEQLPDITADEAKKMVSALDRQLKQAERAAKKSADASKKAAQASAKAAKKGALDFQKLSGAATMAAGAFATMGAGVVMLSQNLADLTNQLTDASAKTGISVETLAGLRLAAEGSGLSFENLEGGLIRFQTSMDNANRGSKTFEESFQKLGVEVKNTDGKLRSSNDVFNEAIKALGTMENTTERNAIAMRLFGREGGAGLIQSGALDNLDNMTEFARKFGVSINEDAIGAMGNFQRSMAEFDTVSQGAMQRVVNAITGSDNGINRAIELASSAVIFLGSVTEQTLDGMRGGFEAMFLVIKAGSAALSRDFKTAADLISLAGERAADSFFFMPRIMLNAAEAVEEFNTASEKTKTNLEKTKTSAEGAGDGMEKLGKKTKEANNALKEQRQFFRDIITPANELAEQIRERLTPEYEKQREEVLKLGKELDSQKESLQLELDLLNEETELREATTQEMLKKRQLVMHIDELEALAAENRKAEQAELLEMTNKRVKAEVGAIGDLFGTLSDLSAAFNEDSKEGNLRAFAMQKQLSTASIIMKTAEAIMAAQLLGPPLNAIQTGIAVATGAAQLAKVQSTQPPSFHMGGIAPDETTARVLKGEAVLSRGAVQRMGGEQGIRQIEQGSKQGNDRIVIIQPFKHFGRFARELGFQQPKQTGIRGY